MITLRAAHETTNAAGTPGPLGKKEREKHKVGFKAACISDSKVSRLKKHKYMRLAKRLWLFYSSSLDVLKY